MRQQRHAAGLTILDLLASVLVVATALVIAVPTIAGAKGNSGVQQSMSNMATLGVAHVLYALDWDLRQVTWVKDDLGVYAGNVVVYNSAMDCGDYPPPPPEVCQPPAVAGWDCNGVGPWAYWVTQGNNVMFQPLHFPNTPGTCTNCPGWGTFRIPNLRPLHDYLNGRYHDPAYYAPNDTAILAPLEGCLGVPCEFNSSSECNPGWSSYAMSPASMFHHDVMRSNAAGGWQAPWTLDHGYQAPGLFQAPYPNLKTLMIENSWVQDPPAECNPAFVGCEPYYFNAGIDSNPVTLFYDISVRLLPNTEVYVSDQQVLKQTGGVDGLWHRGTPFGEEGYFIPDGYDGTPLSHHVLTTDGILGRDTLGGAVPLSAAARSKTAVLGKPALPAPPDSLEPPDQHYIRFTQPMEAVP